MAAAARLPSPKLAQGVLDRVCREQQLTRPEATSAIAKAGIALGLVQGRLN